MGKAVIILSTILACSFIFLYGPYLKIAFSKSINPSNSFISPSVINRVETDKKEIALTFDADMTYKMKEMLKEGKVRSWFNKDIIDFLEKQNIPATLFLTGLWIKNYPNITQELSKNNLFEIGNHSFSHQGFSKPCYHLGIIKNTRDDYEIEITDKLLQKYAPNYKKYFRFPGLCYDSYDIESVKKHGYTIIHGDIISGDAFQKNYHVIVSKVINRVKPGSIIIFHIQGGPDAPDTALALKKIIPVLKNEDYQFVKVSQLLQESATR